MDKNFFQLERYDLSFLQSQWISLTSHYAATATVVESLFNSLVEQYSALDRAYHNLSHIQSLISLSESLPDKIQVRDAVSFAIWFHDIIYETKRSDNEEESADFAEIALASLTVSGQTIAITKEMILATKSHSGANLSWDTMAFLDLDTAILGAPEEIYKEYSRAIRTEYSWVPDTMYRSGRTKVLNDFLERERIYFTDEIGARYELQARINIAQEIRILSDLSAQ